MSTLDPTPDPDAAFIEARTAQLVAANNVHDVDKALTYFSSYNLDYSNYSTYLNFAPQFPFH
jgi:hypothetical protein